MSSLFPFRTAVDHEPTESTVVGLTDEAADEVFATLSSATARTILEALYEEPRTPRDLRDVVGTSAQNVHYHLTNMENAGLIGVVGTWYSDRGNEMKVYGPSSRALLVLASDREDRGLLEGLLARLFAVVVLVGLSFLAFSVMVPATTTPGLEAASGPAGGAGAGGAGGGAAAVAPEVAFALGAGVALVAVGVVLAASLARGSARRRRPERPSE